MAKKLDPSDFSSFSLHSGHKQQTGGYHERKENSDAPR